MVEKRSNYRKKVNKKKSHGFFQNIKSAFGDKNSEFDLDADVQQKNEDEASTRIKRETIEERNTETNVDKGLRLKKRLNRAILIVTVLIFIVLFALFHF